MTATLSPPPNMADTLVYLTKIAEEQIKRLSQIEERLSISVIKESYTTEEVADRLSRSAWTVRQWCNAGVIQAKKVRGRGRQGEWRIPHAELVRLQNEGSPLLTQTTL